MSPLWRRIYRQLFLAASLGSIVSWCAGQGEVSGSQPDPVVLFEQVSPAVVRVIILSEDPSQKGLPAKLWYTGFFIDGEGHVLTNIPGDEPISRVFVERGGLSYLAEVVGRDLRTRLALLQVVKLPEKFASIAIPEASAPLPVGSTVFEVSRPLELAPSPALGLITGYESEVASQEFPFTYTRVNLPTGLGEGGSPFVDRDGSLVGISVASIPAVRSSYLVPARALGRIVADILKDGEVAYGTLPLEFAEQPDPSNTYRQVVVTSVVPDSSAARADVRVGDIVRQLGPSTIRRMNDLRDAVFYAYPGQFISLEVERDGRRIPFALPIERLREAQQSPPTVDPSANQLEPLPQPGTLSAPTRPQSLP